MYEKSNTLVVNEETDTTILKIEVFSLVKWKVHTPVT